jgi:hypothetical protein
VSTRHIGQAGLAPDQPFVRAFATYVGRRIPVAVRHDLCGHPALTPRALAGLTAITARSAPGALTVLDVADDPTYDAVAEAVLAGFPVGADAGPVAPERRGAFLVACPAGSVTPTRVDGDHRLLLQLVGHRRIGFGSVASVEDREHEVRRSRGGLRGRLEPAPVPGQVLELRPGTGVYLPPDHPYRMVTGEEASVSLTVAFSDRSHDRLTVAARRCARALRGGPARARSAVA